MKSNILVIGFCSVIGLLFLYVIYQTGYHNGNADGLKKAYRYEMFRKYPEYFRDWEMYGAEINQGNGKKGRK